MKRLILFGVVLLAFAWGYATHAHRIFPYDLVKSLRSAGTADRQERFNPRRSLFDAFSPDVEIVMIGDSLTEGGLWAEFFPEYAIANRGVGGDGVRDILARIDTILATKPEVASIMVGVNDMFRGRTPEETAADIGALIERLQAEGVRVVLQHTVECARYRCNETLTRIRALNALLSAFAETYGIEVVDPNTVLSNDKGLRPEMTYDAVHLNGQGYKAWVAFMRTEGIFAGSD